jgi:hypothetical protein
MTRPTWREPWLLIVRICLSGFHLDAYPNCGDVFRVSAGADTARRSANDDVPWQQRNSQPRTEALTQPVRLWAGMTALPRFVQ